jgi:hypothetical protein
MIDIERAEELLITLEECTIELAEIIEEAKKV